MLNPVYYRDRKGREWYVPMGLPHDGVSWPPFLNRLPCCNPYDIQTRREAALHDCHFALNDYYPDWKSIMPLFDINVNLLDGFRLSRPRVAFIVYLFVKLFGYVVWDHKSRDPLMVQWLEMIQRSDNELREWIRGAVAEYGTESSEH